MKPSRHRHALDQLLARYPTFDVLRVELQSGELQPRPGPWLLVDLGDPGAAGDWAESWALWRFAVWCETGDVYRVDDSGAVMDPPVIVMRGGEPRGRW